MKVEVDFDLSGTLMEIEKRTKRAQMKLDAQVLKDSNFYCPMDTSHLIKSSILSSKIGSGELKWNTPYAREQYYGFPNKSHQKNPNAQMRWFEVAKSKKIGDWVRLINDEYSKDR